MDCFNEVDFILYINIYRHRLTVLFIFIREVLYKKGATVAILDSSY